MKSINIRSLHKKLVILDLWGTFCGSCIDGMPEMVELQKSFSDDIQILMVTKNTSAQVNALAKRSENVKNNPLPFINGEQPLSRMFDYTFVPTHVWVDSTGRIVYITDGQNSKPASINNYLKGKALNYVEKKTIRINTTGEPLLVQMYPYFKDNFYFYSYFAPRDDSQYKFGGSQANGLDAPGNVKLVSGNSFLFDDLYRIAYGFNYEKPIANNRIMCSFNDTSRWRQPQRTYVYELIARRSISAAAIKKYMQTQLDISFNVNSSLEKNEVPCYVLTLLPGGMKNLGDPNQKTKINMLNNNHITVLWDWREFTIYMNRSMKLGIQVIDETGTASDKIVSLDLNIDFKDFDAVQKSFAANGILIEKKQKILDCIIIKNN